jgi:CheY-like chemotaxis protein/nitrogen-specific signal transduction histidine kinase
MSGKVESVIGVSSNITDHVIMEKKLESLNLELAKAKLKAEESDRLKSAFLANMSHEIRTPMNAILGFSDLLRECEDESERQEFINIIDSNGEVLLTLLNDIIDLSKIEGGQLAIKPEKVYVVDLMKEIEQLYITKISKLKKPNLRLNLEIPINYKNLQIKTDRSRLFQVFVNLIDNAIKFTDEGSVIFGFHIKDSYLKFFVKDTGIGIKKSDLKIIFERFMQVRSMYDGKYGGTGLGLSISKKLVELLGGNLSVESRVKEGSVFSFSLPLLSADIKRSNYKKKIIIRSSKKGKDRTILIVEDEDSSKRLIETLLEPLNVNVLSVSSGEEAVELCQNNENINLVLMDLKLPHMSGFEATTRIKNLHKNIYVVAQTALIYENEKEQSIKCGCDDFITKPIKTKRLINTINKFMH